MSEVKTQPSGAERVARGAPMPERHMWIDGALKRGAEATLSLFDRGARDGEGIFETVRVHGGRPFLWTRHLERMVLAAAELGFPVPPSPATLERAMRELLAAEGLTDAVVRITVTRGIAGGRPTRAGCWIEAEPVGGRLWKGTRSGSASVVLSKRPFTPGPLGPYKTTSRLAYHLAREEARAAGADEVLLLTAQREVLEGAASNVFLVADGEVATPSLGTGILPGITRAFVLRTCHEFGVRVRSSAMWRDELFVADEVFLTNAVQGIVSVGRIDGRPVAGREFGQRVRDAYTAAVEAATS